MGIRDAAYLSKANLCNTGGVGVFASGLAGVIGVLIAYQSSACEPSQDYSASQCHTEMLECTAIGAASLPVGIIGATFGYETLKSCVAFLLQAGDLLMQPLSEETYETMRHEQRIRPPLTGPLTGPLTDTNTLALFQKKRKAASMQSKWNSLPMTQRMHKSTDSCPISYGTLQHEDPREALAEPVTINNQAGVYEYKPLLTAWVYKDENPLTREHFNLSQLRQIDAGHIEESKEHIV